MPLMKLQFQPGINRETTGYANEGGWWDCDKIRFRMGYPEKIGGWERYNNSFLLGTCRAIHPWVALDNNEYIGLGTSTKYYVAGSGGYNDITPIRATTAAGDVTFTATNGSSTITVSDTGHGAFVGDYVTFSGAVSLGGTITAAVLNQEYQIAAVTNGNTYTIKARTVSTIASITTTSGLNPTLVVANASDTGHGGAAVIGAYQINTGLDTSVIGSGWGAGTWGGTATGTLPATGWGSAANATASGAQLRLWGHDNFGENLFFNVRDGGIYYWAKSTSYPRAVALNSLAGSTYAPTIAKQVIVGDNNRQLIVFGCDDLNTPGVQDPLLIRYSDNEDVTTWFPDATNSAGTVRIGSGSTIVTAVETKQQIIVLTDTSVHALRYLGPPNNFGLTLESDNISIAGPNAAITVDDSVYWMGEGDFYIYNGIVSQVPCDVKDYIFSRIDPSQTSKVVAGANINYGEVWWFYQSNTAGVTENDSYVCYNYQQRIWYYGTMTRTAWTHKNLGIYPIAASTDHAMYLHEYGNDDGSQNPPVGISAFIESSGQDLGDGDKFAFIWRLIPDLTFRASTGTPQATFTVKMSNFPGADFTLPAQSNVVTQSASYPVETFTNQVFTRLRGRSFTFRISSSNAGTAWRLGAPRLDIRTDGKR